MGAEMRALVADDEPVTRAIVASALTKLGFAVATETSGDAALRWLLQAEGPTLAVLDWMMPLQFGPDICRRVRAERPMANIYLMLLTALESRQHLVEGLDAGADDYLVKPCHPERSCARGSRSAGGCWRCRRSWPPSSPSCRRRWKTSKQLSGLLPICSYCKRIRGDDEYCQQVETYIAERSNAQFSHGICPACYVNVTRELENP